MSDRRLAARSCGTDDSHRVSPGLYDSGEWEGALGVISPAGCCGSRGSQFPQCALGTGCRRLRQGECKHSGCLGNQAVGPGDRPGCCHLTVHTWGTRPGLDELPWGAAVLPLSLAGDGRVRVQWCLWAPVGGSAGCSPRHTVTTREHTAPRVAGGSLTAATHVPHPRRGRGRSEQVARWAESKVQAGLSPMPATQAADTVGKGAVKTASQTQGLVAKGSCPPAYHRLGTSATGSFGALLMTVPCPTEVTTTIPKNGPPQPCEQGPEHTRPGLQLSPAHCPLPSPGFVGDKASLCPQSKPHCTAAAGPTWRWESRTGDLISYSQVDTATTDHLNPRTEAMETQTRL